MALALKETHPGAHATERQLVRAVRDGDDRAFEQLFSRYRRRISAYIYGLLNDHGRAEDITQDVFISALRRLRETDRPIAFKPWIYEIARNACIDEFRRLSRATLVSLDADPDEEGAAVPELADHTTPEVRFERKQELGDLFGAFSGLSDNQHRILVLRELEGLSYGEIGERMGMSRPMVESTLFRARRRLTAEYDELASGRRCLDVQAAVDRQDARGLHTLGIRERRRIARHLHHCQDCLRYARMAGVDRQALEVAGIARRVAALLPFGWIRSVWGGGRARLHGAAAMRSAQHASSLGEGTPQAVAVGRAAAAAAALLITGGSISMLTHQHVPTPAGTAASTASAPAWYPTSVVNVLEQVPVLVAPHTAAATRPAGTPGARRAHHRAALGHATHTVTRGSAPAAKTTTKAASVKAAHRQSGSTATPGVPPSGTTPPGGGAPGLPGLPSVPPVPLPIQHPLGIVGPIVNRVTHSLPPVNGGQTPGLPVPPGSVLPAPNGPVTVPSLPTGSGGGLSSPPAPHLPIQLP